MKKSIKNKKFKSIWPAKNEPDFIPEGKEAKEVWEKVKKSEKAVIKKHVALMHRNPEIKDKKSELQRIKKTVKFRWPVVGPSNYTKSQIDALRNKALAVIHNRKEFICSSNEEWLYIQLCIKEIQIFLNEPDSIRGVIVRIDASSGGEKTAAKTKKGNTEKMTQFIGDYFKRNKNASFNNAAEKCAKQFNCSIETVRNYVKNTWTNRKK